MEIIFTNNAKDRSVYRYKKDFEMILERACQVLDRKGEWSLSVIYVTDMLIEEDQYELGDIFINVQAIRDQAKAYGHSIRREACFLFCHGLLHLMGYDHMKEEDEKVMFALQDEILDELVQR